MKSRSPANLSLQSLPERPGRAWLFSGLFHLMLVLALAISVRVPGPSPSGDRWRKAAIVLAVPRQDQGAEYVGSSDEDLATDQHEADAAVTPEVFPDAMSAESLTATEITLPEPVEVGPLPVGTMPEAGGLRTGAPARVTGSIDTQSLEDEAKTLAEARAARGVPARISLFGGPAAEGRSFVFLIDRSKSMGRQGLGALEAAEKELLRSVASLQPNHTFQVIAYHDRCVYLERRAMLQATRENKTRINGFLSGLAALGATEHERALLSALSQEPDVIYLLTDGGDPPLSDGQIRRIAQLARGRTTIHCVEFGFGPLQDSDSFLRRLAHTTGGSYAYVDMNESRE